MEIITDVINGITSDVWATLFGSLVGIIMSAIVSYIVSKNNIKSQQESIDKQINAEVEKVRIQYEFEQKRDNNNYLNRFKIEKLAELYELVGQFARNNVQLTLLIQGFFREFKLPFNEEDINSFEENREKIEESFFEENTMRKITILVTYFPNIRDKWEIVTANQNRYVNMFPDQIMGTLVIKQEMYNTYKLPEDYTLNKYFDDLEFMQVEVTELMEVITIETDKIMSILSE